jgi:two-component system NtrC family sensor kinase
MKKKKFTYERSLTMKLFGSSNKPLLRNFCRYSREQRMFLPKETLVTEEKKENQSELEKLENIAALGTLLAGVAHEINNPMTFVNTSVYNLKHDLEKLKAFLFNLAVNEVDNDILSAFDERFEILFKHLDTLNEGTNRIQEIVRNLKSFSQMNNMETKQVNIQEGIESTLNLVKAGYKYYVDFITDFKPDLVIQGNQGKLKHVFMNIIINACHAIVERQKRKGEVTKGRLTIQTWKEADYAAISFQDNGIGMSREVKSRMFEPFFTTKRGNKGTGLGLSISEKIVKEHGGEIEVQSMEGKGTTIILYFPLALQKIKTSPVKLKNSKEHLIC